MILEMVEANSSKEMAYSSDQFCQSYSFANATFLLMLALLLCVEGGNIQRRTDEDVQNLIRLRMAKESLFSGKRFSSAAGWEAVIQEMGLTHLSPARAAEKWEHLKETYKELISPPTGSGTEAGDPPAASWKWFSLMNEAIGSRPSVRPPYLIASAWKESPSTSSAPSPASVPQEQEQTGDEEEDDIEEAPSAKRSRRGSLISLLEKAERREEEIAMREEERARREEERDERLLSLLEKIVQKM